MAEGKEPDVLQYLQNINRPCSVNDIVQGLHLDSKKTSIQKILDTLVSGKKIREKVYNKSKIYCCVQPPNCDVNRIRDEVNNVDAKIIDRTNAVNELEKQLKQTENSLAKYKSMLSLEEAKNEKEKLITSVKLLKTRLEASINDKDVISMDERRRIETTYENITKTYRKRKRICNEILDTILENYPKKKSNLMEEIGLESDDTVVPSV